jgi:hypothetical protein
MKKILLFCLIAVMLIISSTKINAQDDKPQIKVNVLLQPWLYFAENESALKKNGVGYDFYIRRARIILSGNVNDWIYFFCETDNPNFGKTGLNDKGESERKYDGMFMQDAFVDFRIAPEIQIATGMILLPFSHQSRMGAVTIHSLDYQNIFSGHMIQEKVWRDYGVEARGLVFNKSLGYRFGFFGGKSNTQDQIPRITGRVDANLFDAEDSFFYNGIYFGKKKIFSFGAGFDIQPGAVTDNTGKSSLYYAMTGDVFVDYPLDNNELIFQAGAAWYERGYTSIPNSTNFATHIGTGLGIFGELGFRCNKIEPIISFNMFDSKADGKDITNVNLGFNIWLKEKFANIKTEYGLLKKENEKMLSIFKIQTQLFF